MAEQRESAPSGVAGLVRYEEEKSLVNIKPDYVFGGIAAITEIELLIQGLFLIAAAFGVLFGLMLYWMYMGRVAKQPVKAQTASAPVPQQQLARQNSVQ